MSAGKATFISGIVVGATTGFVLGHLVLWSQVSTSQAAVPETRTASLPDDVNPLLPDIDFWNPLHTSQQKGEVYYAPVAAAQVQTGEGTGPIDVSPPSNVAAPPSFLPPPDASPIGAGIEIDLRPVIEREIPDLPEQELEVWLDVLQGLSEDDALGILRMWQLNGGSMPPGVGTDLGSLNAGPIDLDIGSPESDYPDPLATDNEPTTTDEHDVLAQLRGITLHNIANAETPGYRSLVPIVSNLVHPPLSGTEPHSYGIRLERVTLSIEEGPIIRTGEQWDIAIRQHAHLFFQLQHSGDTALTRYGHFELDEARRLSIAANDHHWVLEPEVVIPEGASHILVDSNGEVNVRLPSNTDFDTVGRIQLVAVHSPGGLEPIGDRLYRLPEPLRDSLGPAESCELIQGSIEGSNVDLSTERGRLTWIDELLRLGR